MADAPDEHAPDGPVARRIASAIPYYPYKGIPRFYDINGFLVRPDVFQLVIDVLAKRYAALEIDSIGGFDARGFVIGAPLALALKKPFFMLRKPGKQPNAVTSGAYEVEYGSRAGVSVPRGHPLSAEDPLKLSTVVKRGDRVLLVDDLVATGGTLAAGVELIHRLGARVAECACVVELKMFYDPPAGSGLPSRKALFEGKRIADVPVWALISEDILTVAGELPAGYEDDGEEH
ncbi:hypothetical protein KFE25_002929 [Diacronema lutheri]|uniref:adenine phosphoribosyltransferase n=2 Tax=Diacronema lutheri TaxID=2081491 RepID=A0A8J6C8R5_DIALT|nr:hypothetical protein KFE25_002929 [Diacronema lutheri]